MRNARKQCSEKKHQDYIKAIRKHKIGYVILPYAYSMLHLTYNCYIVTCLSIYLFILICYQFYFIFLLLFVLYTNAICNKTNKIKFVANVDRLNAMK